MSRVVEYPGGVRYYGRLSAGGYVGPEIVVEPSSRTVVIDRGMTWILRVAAEIGEPGRRCVQIEFRAKSERRFRTANPLCEREDGAS